MPALQVRELPEETYNRLKKCAADNHRSIAQQTTALVEEGLARRGYYDGAPIATTEALEADGIPALDVIPVPSNVRDASERARFVNPFAWSSCLDVEPEEVLEARREKRRRVCKKIASIEWNSPKLSADEIVAMIRESREDRDDSIIENVLRYSHEKGKQL